MSRNGVIMLRRVYGIFHAHSSADLVAHCTGLPARHALLRPVSHFGTTRNPHRSSDRCSDRHGSIHFSLSPLPTNTARTQPSKAIRLVDSVNRFSDAPTTLSFLRSLRTRAIPFFRAHRLLEEKNVNPLLLQLHFALLQSFHRAASVWILHHATNSRTVRYPGPFNILGRAVHSIPLCCLSFFVCLFRVYCSLPFTLGRNIPCPLQFRLVFHLFCVSHRVCICCCLPPTSAPNLGLPNPAR